MRRPRRPTPLLPLAARGAALAAGIACGCRSERDSASAAAPAAEHGAERAPAGRDVRRGALRDVARAPSALHVLAAPLPAARASVPLDSPIRIEVLDARGRPAPDALVSWRVLRGGGHVVPAAARTDRAGVASASWSPGPSADPQVVSVAVPGVGAVELRTAVSVGALAVRPESVALWPGDSLTLRADLFDATRRPLSGGAPRWESADTATARVTPGGTVLALRAGLTSVSAGAGAARDSASVVVLPTVAGRLFAVPDAEPPIARVVVRAGRRTDSTTTTADGRFALRLPAFPDDTVDVTVEPRDGRLRGAHLRVRSARELAELRIVLLPAAWLVTGGRYAGRSVPIDPALPVARASDGSRFWRLERDGARATSVPAAWRHELLPVRLAFRAGPAGAVSTGDSIAFWRIARALERDLDAALFVPAAESGADADDGMIQVVVDPASRDAGFTVASWSATGAVGGATVILRSASFLSDARLVTHELLHALGIGHTDAWPSVMAPGGHGSDTLTAPDAAYAQLLLHLRRVQEERDAPYAVLEGAAGRGSGVAPAATARRDAGRIP